MTYMVTTNDTATMTSADIMYQIKTLKERMNQRTNQKEYIFIGARLSILLAEKVIREDEGNW